LGADAICLRVVITGQGLEPSPQTTAKATIAANAAILAEPRAEVRVEPERQFGPRTRVRLKERIVSVSSRSLAEEAV